MSEDGFTFHVGMESEGTIKGFMLNLEGDEAELKRVLAVVWKEMMAISNEKEVIRLQPSALSPYYRRVVSHEYCGPSGELQVRRAFP